MEDKEFIKNAFEKLSDDDKDNLIMLTKILQILQKSEIVLGAIKTIQSAMDAISMAKSENLKETVCYIVDGMDVLVDYQKRVLKDLEELQDAFSLTMVADANDAR